VWLVMMCPRDQERVREYKYLSVLIASNVYPLSVLVIQVKALVVTDNFPLIRLAWISVRCRLATWCRNPRPLLRKGILPFSELHVILVYD
jgi:hypothetical protein